MRPRPRPRPLSPACPHEFRSRVLTAIVRSRKGPGRGHASVLRRDQGPGLAGQEEHPGNEELYQPPAGSLPPSPSRTLAARSTTIPIASKRRGSLVAEGGTLRWSPLPPAGSPAPDEATPVGCPVIALVRLPRGLEGRGILLGARDGTPLAWKAASWKIRWPLDFLARFQPEQGYPGPA